MVTVVLLIHLMIASALVAVVLLQRSEGGALGIGGGGGGAGGFLTGRGTANLLTRVTAGLAAAFFVTSMLLSIMAQHGSSPTSVFDQPAGQSSGAPAQPGQQPEGAPRGGVLDRLQPGGAPVVPQTR